MFKKHIQGFTPKNIVTEKSTMIYMRLAGIALVLILIALDNSNTVMIYPQTLITISDKPFYIGIKEVSFGKFKDFEEIEPMVFVKNELFEVEYGTSQFFSKQQVNIEPSNSVANFAVLDYGIKTVFTNLDSGNFKTKIEKKLVKPLVSIANSNSLKTEKSKNINLVSNEFEKKHEQEVLPKIAMNNDEHSKANMPKVMSAVRKASALTGMDPAFLMAVAWKESRFNPYDTTGYTSAGGMFQFLDQSWLVVMKRYGAKHGYAGLADSIVPNSNGDMRVNSNEALKTIMELKHNIDVSAIMAAESMLEDKHAIEVVLGRSARPVDIYLTHLMGLGGASGFLRNNGVSTTRYAQLTHVVEKQRAIYAEMLNNNPVGSGEVSVVQVDEKLDREIELGRVLQKK